MAPKKPGSVATPYKVVLNSQSSLQDFLQELYDETCKNINEIQNEITKLSSSTTLNEEPMDGRVKYAKAMNDYSSNKNKALATKLDIAKLMTEVIKFNGNVKKMVEETDVAIDTDALKKQLRNGNMPEGKSDAVNNAPRIDIYDLNK